MGGLPNDADAKKCIRALQREFSWEYTDEVGTSSHACGFLSCGDGCRLTVYKTGRNTGRALWRNAGRCPHGHAPTRRHW